MSVCFFLREVVEWLARMSLQKVHLGHVHVTSCLVSGLADSHPRSRR